MPLLYSSSSCPVTSDGDPDCKHCREYACDDNPRQGCHEPSSEEEEYHSLADYGLVDSLSSEEEAYRDWYSKYQRTHGRCPTDEECCAWWY